MEILPYRFDRITMDPDKRFGKLCVWRKHGAGRKGDNLA
jgi:hypothetical protein